MQNPYRSSGSSYISNNVDHEFARRIVVGVACFIVAQSAGLMVLQYLLYGAVPGVTDLIRFGLTVLLAIGLFAGSNIARYLTMLFYGIAAVMSALALPGVYHNRPMVMTLVIGLLVVANAAIPVLLKAPPGIDDQFA